MFDGLQPSQLPPAVVQPELLNSLTPRPPGWSGKSSRESRPPPPAPPPPRLPRKPLPAEDKGNLTLRGGETGRERAEEGGGKMKGGKMEIKRRWKTSTQREEIQKRGRGEDTS